VVSSLLNYYANDKIWQQQKEDLNNSGEKKKKNRIKESNDLPITIE
jgi:hypothetical protein